MNNEVILFKRVTHAPRKTVSFVTHKMSNLDNANIKIESIFTIEVGCFQHMKKINRPDLQYWPIDSVYVDEDEANFYVWKQKQQYKDAGYEILSLQNYENNF